MAPSIRAPVLAIFSGSSRVGSVNSKLAKAAEKIAQSGDYGATTKMLDLASYDLPLYNQDLEAEKGMPDGAMRLKDDLSSADGWIVCSPEYNGFVTPLMLNAMTWCSRGDPKEAGMYATFKDKSAIVLSASPGAMGGMRAVNPNRQLLTNMGVNVLPQSVAVGGAYKAFDDENGDLIDERQKKMLIGAVHSLFVMTRDSANRDFTCKMVKEMNIKPVGEYGSVSVAEK